MITNPNTKRKHIPCAQKRGCGRVSSTLIGAFATLEDTLHMKEKRPLIFRGRANEACSFDLLFYVDYSVVSCVREVAEPFRNHIHRPLCFLSSSTSSFFPVGTASLDGPTLPSFSCMQEIDEPPCCYLSRSGTHTFPFLFPLTWERVPVLGLT